MPDEFGLNCRNTAGFVTDGPDETYLLLADTYPTTRGGRTFGWTTQPDGNLDSDAGLDRRIAGVNYQSNDGTQGVLRLDLLAAGDHDIRTALGMTSSQAYQYMQVLDDATPVLTIDDSNGTGNNEWDDATGTTRTDTTWPNDNLPATVTFTGLICNAVIGTPSAFTQSTTLAHFSISRVDVVATPTRNRKLATQQRMVA